MAAKPKPGRCFAERERLFQLHEDILKVQDELSIPDLPPALRRRLEALLRRLQGQLPAAQRALATCEAKKPPSPGVKKKTAKKKTTKRKTA
jgi:hypothetical protein